MCKNLVHKSVRKDHLRDIGVNGRIILKLIFNTLAGVMWTGFIYLRIGANESETDASLTVYVCVCTYL